MCIGLFKKNKFEIINDPKKAEIIVINTCGFIEPAKEEAINTILEMADYKKRAKCKYLIVMGCLVQRYKKELIKAIPEVDLFVGVDEYENIWNLIENLIEEKKEYVVSKNTLDYLDRIVTTGNKTAYLKISEGCSNNCTYCAIPYIRGKHISRKIEDILEEANMLAEKGIEEVIVIAQDTTKYGIDLYGEYKLPELLEELSKIEGFKWIRFLYSYPESITDELIKVVKENDKICKYFDIPMQHFADGVLKRMNRRSNSKSIEKTINKIREEIPEVILRTTFIVGFPGETEEDFFELYEFQKQYNSNKMALEIILEQLNFIKNNPNVIDAHEKLLATLYECINRAKFEKLGAFKYSKEDGTPAARLKQQVHYKTKQLRYDRIMSLQKQIAKIKLEEKIGNVYEAIVDEIANNGTMVLARSYMDIPNEDGVIYIKNNGQVNVGDFIKVKITDINGYDLIGEFII